MTLPLLSGSTLALFDGQCDFDLAPWLAASHIAEDDIVIVGGELLEGIGTGYSDFHVYVVGDAKPFPANGGEARHAWTTTSDGIAFRSPSDLPGGRLREIFDYAIDCHLGWKVEYWTTDEVARLIRGMHDAYDGALTHTDKLDPPVLSQRESVLLHRLLIGKVVQNKTRFSELMQEFNIEEFCYLGYRQCATGYRDFRDVVGLWHAADFDTAWLALHKHLTDQLFALTFLLRDTNPDKKWIYRKIDRLPPRYRALGSRYRDLFGARPATIETEQFVLAGLDLMDDICSGVRELLDSSPRFLPADDAIRLTRREYAKRRETPPQPELIEQYLYREKFYRDGLPPFRSFVESAKVGHYLELADCKFYADARAEPAVEGAEA